MTVTTWREIFFTYLIFKGRFQNSKVHGEDLAPIREMDQKLGYNKNILFTFIEKIFGVRK